MKLKALILGAALSAGSLFANSVTISDTANDGDLNGGEFLATTSHDGTFLTFCLEAGITVVPGTTYSYTIDSRAYSGALDLHDPVGAGPAGDPISQGTAWLFTQFHNGTLVDAAGSGNYFDAGTRDYNAGMLQTAFWILEDELNAGNYGTNPYYVGNTYVALVSDALHYGSLAGAQASYTGWNVKALNLWDGVNDVQSQLVYVPDTGMTVALLGLGLLSLAAFRRKL